MIFVVAATLLGFCSLLRAASGFELGADVVLPHEKVSSTLPASAKQLFSKISSAKRTDPRAFVSMRLRAAATVTAYKYLSLSMYTPSGDEATRTGAPLIASVVVGDKCYHEMELGYMKMFIKSDGTQFEVSTYTYTKNDCSDEGTLVEEEPIMATLGCMADGPMLAFVSVSNAFPTPSFDAMRQE
jgi:hypothetical protein